MGFGMSMRAEFRQEAKMLQTTVDRITPEGVCPNCKKQLDNDEIVKGWNQTVHDLTTRCPDCGTRFVANLIYEIVRPALEERKLKSLVKRDAKLAELRRSNYESGEVTVRYYCPTQLFHAMKEVLRKFKRKYFGQEWLYDHAPDLIINLIKHFGNYRIGMLNYKASLA